MPLHSNPISDVIGSAWAVTGFGSPSEERQRSGVDDADCAGRVFVVTVSAHLSVHVRLQVGTVPLVQPLGVQQVLDAAGGAVEDGAGEVTGAFGWNGSDATLIGGIELLWCILDVQILSIAV